MAAFYLLLLSTYYNGTQKPKIFTALSFHPKSMLTLDLDSLQKGRATA